MDQKLEIIRQVESCINKRKMLEGLGVSKSTYYHWLSRYRRKGAKGLERKSRDGPVWNRLTPAEKAIILREALSHSHLSPRELSFYITDRGRTSVSESTVYRILKAAGLVMEHPVKLTAAKEFHHKTRRVNEMWASDITYIKVMDWGFYFLISVLDDYSRMILAWRLCVDMSRDSISDVVENAIEFTGVNRDLEKPKLLSDNGAGYVGGALNDYLHDRRIKHIYAAPYHPQTNGKIEAYHGTMKKHTSLLFFRFPGDAEEFFVHFVDYYNNERYHEAIGNVTPSDVYCGRREEILRKRKELKTKIFEKRKWHNQRGETVEIEEKVIRDTNVKHPFWSYFGELSEDEKQRGMTE